MAKKLQVFVSSTYTDMKAERQAVIEAILLAGHIPAGMELFAAGDESQLEVIKQWIQDSDVFVLVLGGKYGTVEKTSGKSYIQLEYEHAIALGKPLFAAVIDDDFLTQKIKESDNPAEDMERENYKAYSEFKEQVKSKICRFFKTFEGLKLIVMESLRNIEQTRDLVGWVRADTSANPAPLIEQIGSLQKENSDLRRQLGDAKEQLSVPHFHGYEFREVYDKLDTAMAPVPKFMQKQLNLPPSVSVLTVFWQFQKAFCTGIRSEDFFGKWLSAQVTTELAAYGLVNTEVSTEIHTMSNIMYKMGESPPQAPVQVATTKITDLGRRFLSLLDHNDELKQRITPISEGNAAAPPEQSDPHENPAQPPATPSAGPIQPSGLQGIDPPIQGR